MGEVQLADQIGRESDFVIGYVTVLFGFFAIVGVSSFIIYFDRMKEDFKKQWADQSAEQDKLKLEIDETRNNVEEKFKELKGRFDKDFND
ncbi:MAG: hypothetical protein IPL27_25075 [Lewinellaceae bacterium]|nr:hypothetical protein [Lewinellaceae bacterium]